MGQANFFEYSALFLHQCVQTFFRSAILFFFRGVAQPGSALAWGARGREFESRRPDQQYPRGLVIVITNPLSHSGDFCGDFPVKAAPRLSTVNAGLRVSVAAMRFAYSISLVSSAAE